MIYGIASVTIEFIIIIYLINKTQRNARAINELRQLGTRFPKTGTESGAKKCGKRKCQEPAYEFGMCFKHYMEGEVL